MVTILIADDHSVVREGLKQIIADQRDMVVGGEAKDGSEVLALLKEKKWDVVVLDITMPGKGGIDVLKSIKSEHPEIPVLMLSMHPEDQYAVRAIRAGAAGYLTKESAPEELVAAIRRIVGGRKYITGTVAEMLLEESNEATAQSPHDTLSDREFQVLTLIASGKNTKEIAQEMSLSTKTVSTYRSRLLSKMHLKRNADIIRYAIQSKLVK
jgi:two-component system, NarL family, invasion response regulator UvrY